MKPIWYKWRGDVEVAEALPGYSRGYVPTNALGALRWDADQTPIAVPMKTRSTYPSFEKALGRVHPWVPAFLTSYQRAGVQAALEMPGGSGHFWWSAGSGKTLGAILWGLADAARVITVTKGAVKHQWAAEIQRFVPGIDPLVLESMDPFEIQITASPWIVINYEILPAWIGELERFAKRLQLPPSVVFDESQKVKSHKRWDSEAKESGGVKYKLKGNIAAAAMRLSKIAGRRLATTATPVKDRPRDLWAQLDLIHPGTWGRYWDFAKRYCTPGETPIWMGDFRFKPISKVRVGDAVIGWAFAPTKNARTKTPETAHRMPSLVRGTVTHVQSRMAPVVKVTLASGRVIRCTADHRWLDADRAMRDYDFQFTTPCIGKNLSFVVDPTPIVTPPELHHTAGWLAGMYDGEGHGNFIAQSSRHNPKTFAMLDRALTTLGIPHTMVEDSPTRGAGGAYITDGRAGLMRFYKITRALRFVETASKVLLSAKFRTPDRIVGIEPDGVEPVYALTTTTGNYVAWGYASKNCAATHGEYGMLDFGKSNEVELTQRLQYVVHRVKHSEANANLPPKRRLVVRVPESEQVRAVDVAEMLRGAAGRGGTALLEARLMEAASRKRKALVERVAISVSEDGKVIVFTGRKADGERIRDALCTAFGAGGPKAVPREDGGLQANRVTVYHGDGSSTPKEREAIRKAYMDHPGPCVLVGTTDAWGEGLNLHDTDLLLVGLLPYTPGQIIQLEGRVARLGQNRPVLIEYLIAEGTVDEHVASILIGKLPVVEKMIESDEVSGLTRELGGLDDPALRTRLAEKILGRVA